MMNRLFSKFKRAGDTVVRLTEKDLRPLEDFRKQHNTAVLVVMFTDLEGSTALADICGEFASQSLRKRHNELIEPIVTRDARGNVIKNLGDSLLCVFAEPTAAVERAVEIQQTLANYNHEHPEDLPIRIRIGIHMGQVVVEGGKQMDIFGRHVNRAKRVESIGHAGQVLMTYPVYDSAHGYLRLEGLGWQHHGEYVLDGFTEPVAIYEVYVEGTSAPKPPRATMPKPAVTEPKPRRRKLTRRGLLAVATVALLPLVALGCYLILDSTPAFPEPSVPLDDAQLARYQQMLQTRKSAIAEEMIRTVHSGELRACDLSNLKPASDRLTATVDFDVKWVGRLQVHSTKFVLTISREGVYRVDVAADDKGLFHLQATRKNLDKACAKLRKLFATWQN